MLSLGAHLGFRRPESGCNVRGTVIVSAIRARIRPGCQGRGPRGAGGLAGQLGPSATVRPPDNPGVHFKISLDRASESRARSKFVDCFV